MPPHQILVYDASGRDVSGTVGPLYEGDSLVLSCEVRGGKFECTFSSSLNTFITDSKFENKLPAINLDSKNDYNHLIARNPSGFQILFSRIEISLVW